MDDLRAAKEACKNGTLHDFIAAVSVLVSLCYGLGPDAWPMFARLAFLAGNIPVLEHILGEDMFTWPEQLTRMEEQLDGVQAPRMVEYKTDVEIKLRRRIRGIACTKHLYQGIVRKNLIAVLNEHPMWRTFAAAKAVECCNPQMLQDVFDVISPEYTLTFEEHGELYNKIVATIHALPESRETTDMRRIVAESFGVKQPIRLAYRKGLKRLQQKI